MDLFGIAKIAFFLFYVYTAGHIVDSMSGPALVGELIAGATLGPHLTGFMPETYQETLSIIGDMGLLVLVFEGGLTMDLKQIREVGVKAFLVAFFGTLFPVILGWGLLTACGFSSIEAFASGTALSATAIGFALRLLQDLGMQNTPQGQLITAAALIDDVLSLIVLAVVRAAHEQPSAWHFVRPLAASILIFVFGSICCVTVKHLMENKENAKRVEELARWKMQALMGLVAISFSFLAEYIYSTPLLGVFMSGLIFGTMPSTKDMWEQSPLPQHILPWAVRLFFAASVGFSIPVHALFHGPALKFGALLTVAAFVGKLASGVFGATGSDAFLGMTQVGCAMIGRGELGFMMASEARESGLMGDVAFSATVWALVLATIGGPILFQKALRLKSPAGPPAESGPAIYTFFQKYQNKEVEEGFLKGEAT